MHNLYPCNDTHALRQQKQGGDAKQLVNTNSGPPPPAIAPKSSKKLKLLDIDPLELARQLTIMESQLYQKIKPMECLQRSREQKTENVDNITTVIQTSNRVYLKQTSCFSCLLKELSTSRLLTELLSQF